MEGSERDAAFQVAADVSQPAHRLLSIIRSGFGISQVYLRLDASADKLNWVGLVGGSAAGGYGITSTGKYILRQSGSERLD